MMGKTLLSIRHYYNQSLTKNLVKLKNLKKKQRLENKALFPKTTSTENIPIFEMERSERNRVYVWGVATSGALGIPDYLRPGKYTSSKYKRTGIFRSISSRFHPVRCGYAEIKGVTDIATGYGFTLFALQGESQLMGTGLNTEGQLGYHAPLKGRPLNVLIQPLPLSLPIKTKIKKVAAGRAHSLALTSNGIVFSFGNNAYGQCGRITLSNEDYFASQVIHQIKGFEEERIVDIVAGQDHSFFLSDSGSLFSCGWSADGQTGLHHYTNQELPSRVEGDIKFEKIVKVSSAADCVLALNDQGQVFAWGNSEYGQFKSICEHQQLYTPRYFPLNGLGKIIDIASGGTICMILNENKELFVWGYGILGKGPVHEASSQPIQIPSSLFGSNKFSPTVTLESIYCGMGSQGALNSNGDLYMWGKNRGGCLGIGHSQDQYFPFKVSLSLRVKKVCLGVDHSAVLCKP